MENTNQLKRHTQLSYSARRMLAIMKGKENTDDFDNPETFTIYNVSRQLIIHCNTNNLSYWLKNTNYNMGNK